MLETITTLYYYFSKPNETIFTSDKEKAILLDIINQYRFQTLDHQLEEIMERYNNYPK